GGGQAPDRTVGAWSVARAESSPLLRGAPGAAAFGLPVPSALPRIPARSGAAGIRRRRAARPERAGRRGARCGRPRRGGYRALAGSRRGGRGRAADTSPRSYAHSPGALRDDRALAATVAGRAAFHGPRAAAALRPRAPAVRAGRGARIVGASLCGSSCGRRPIGHARRLLRG